MRRGLTAITSGAVAAGIVLSTGGCGSGAPALEKPNNSLEVAANNINYAPSVGGVALSQTVKLVLPSVPGQKQPETLNVWNFTKSVVDPAQIRSVANFLINDVAENPKTWRFSINYNDGTIHRKVSIVTFASESTDREHDMFLEPYDAPTPPGGFQDAGTMTEYLDQFHPGEPQTESVVYRAEDSNGNPETFFGPDAGLAIEMCQAEVSTIPITTGLDPNLDLTIVEHLDQEVFCNSEGELINAEMEDLSYSGYQAYVRGQQDGTVSDSAGDTWLVDPFTVSKTVYAQAHRELVGSAH